MLSAVERKTITAYPRTTKQQLLLLEQRDLRYHADRCHANRSAPSTDGVVKTMRSRVRLPVSVASADVCHRVCLVDADATQPTGEERI